MWAIAKYDLRLLDSEFWDLSLAQFMMLIKRHHEKQKAEMFKVGVIGATLYNVAPRGKNAKVITPENFLGWKNKPKPKMTSRQMMEALMLKHPPSKEFFEKKKIEWQTQNLE